jgi:bifunctional ADP-heptose synthase (sugar kinase/adenylyltransferase)
MRLVVVFDEDNPAEMIAALKPDLLVKAADWTMNGWRRSRSRLRRACSVGAAHQRPLHHGADPRCS